MPGFQCGVVGLTGAGVPATAVVTPNARVKATLGFVGTVADVVQFPGPPILGNWVMPATRCLVSGIPAIHGSCVGIAYAPSPPSGLAPVGPMQATSPDTRASGL